jgi:hypothetical protein
MLRRKHAVPLILCNYDGFYMGLMHFLKACDANGTLAAPELRDVLLADNNEEARSADALPSHRGLCDCSEACMRLPACLSTSCGNSACMQVRD